MKVIPSSTARWIRRRLWASESFLGLVLECPPRQSRLTISPVLPRGRRGMPPAFTLRCGCWASAVAAREAAATPAAVVWQEFATVRARARHGRLSSAVLSHAGTSSGVGASLAERPGRPSGERPPGQHHPQMVRWENGAVQRSKPRLDLHSPRQTGSPRPRTGTRGDAHHEDDESDARLRPDRTDGGTARRARRRPAGHSRRAAAGRPGASRRRGAGTADRDRTITRDRGGTEGRLHPGLRHHPACAQSDHPRADAPGPARGGPPPRADAHPGRHRPPSPEHARREGRDARRRDRGRLPRRGPLRHAARGAHARRHDTARHPGLDRHPLRRGPT